MCSNHSTRHSRNTSIDQHNGPVLQNHEEENENDEEQAEEMMTAPDVSQDEDETEDDDEGTMPSFEDSQAGDISSRERQDLDSIKLDLGDMQSSKSGKY